MINVRFDTKEINKALNNSVSYSYGFLEGTNVAQLDFNMALGQFILDALNKYIDMRAKMNPDALHHVYEWGQTGSPSGRLFDIKVAATKRTIKFSGKFLRSSSIANGADVPFYDKAGIMENAIEVVIEPRNSNVLAFEDDGETVFVASAIHIANPGGDEVAGSFGRTVDSFFDEYLTGSFLRSSGIFDKIESAQEFYRYFPSGVKSGKFVGVTAGKKYMTMPKGVSFE